MALNYRRPAIRLQSEKSVTSQQPAKTFTGKEANITRRPALCEIKNQISNRDAVAKRAPVGKKPELTTQKSVTQTTKPTALTTSNLAVKDPKKVIIGLPKPDIKKAITTKFDNECKIKEVSTRKSFSSQRFDALEEEVIGNDPQFVPEYINEIYSYLQSLEDKYRIDPLFLSCHKTTPRMRTILVNWLVEVQGNFKFLSETLHLCIAIIDRYLQKNKSIGRENLQLVGITALWIAGKYEEMYMSDVSDFVYLCENAFSVEQMMKMELSIIRTLDYSFGRPLSLHFLRRYSRVNNVQPREHALAKYFLELALIELDLCHVRPSLQAAAAIYLSLCVLNKEHDPAWSKTLVHYSSHSFENIEKIVKLLAEAVVKAETSKHQAIRIKYAATNNAKISVCAELKGPVIKKYTQK